MHEGSDARIFLAGSAGTRARVLGIDTLSDPPTDATALPGKANADIDTAGPRLRFGRLGAAYFN